MDTPLDLYSWLRLTSSPALTHAQRALLLSAFGAPENIYAAPRADIVGLIGEAGAHALRHEPPSGCVRRAERWLALPKRYLVTVNDGRYPALFREVPGMPLAMYVVGRPELLNAPTIAIVGSRNATLTGKRDAESFGAALSREGWTIASGMALGIDASAHRGGLSARGSSIAVLGTGADEVYPRGNSALAEQLEATGTLISEFDLGTQPIRGNVPRRNRLISGLARGVLVVEATLESGSLITAECALHQNRDVFALPGSIHSPLSKGCHRLIQHGAKLVQSADDILSEWRAGTKVAPAIARAATPPEDAFLEAIGFSPISIDEIASATGRSAAAIAGHLSILELRGAVTSLAGGFFQRLQKPAL
jgi:DNA processing protein